MHTDSCESVIAGMERDECQIKWNGEMPNGNWLNVQYADLLRYYALNIRI